MIDDSVPVEVFTQPYCTISFDLTGRTLDELYRRARERLAQCLGLHPDRDELPVFRLDVRDQLPVEFGKSTPLWRAEVYCEVPERFRPDHEEDPA